jgi:hypothetical protein
MPPSKSLSRWLVNWLTRPLLTRPKALSNWQAALGAPNSPQIKPHFPGEKGSTQKASAEQTIALAKQAVEGKKPGQSIFISNDQPYIGRLNDGHSKQQPPGFFDRALAKTRRFKPKIKLKV